MGTITSLFVRKVVRAAGQDIDHAAVLRSVGLDPDRQIDVTERITDVAYYDMLETIAAQLDDAVAFPLRVGQSMDADDYGAFGLAWKTAPTLRGSLQRAERYAQLLTSVAAYEVCDTERGAFFRTHRSGLRRLGMRLSNEATLASVTSIIRQVSPASFSPLEVHFQHPAPASIAAHEAYFGCPVHFGSDADEILISSVDLDRPNHLGDPAVSKFLDAHLQSQLAAQTGQTSFEDVMMRKISDALSEGVPRAARIAREMGVSERTLHRRVSQHGTSFQSILENAQRRLAEGLLVQSDHSIAEIAFLTGFSEQSAFTRAFKRWVNETPAAFRETRGATR